jgi:hypothetical protein
MSENREESGMKCSECVKNGLTSRVYDHGSTRTLMGWVPYYDEDGKPHNHDPNATTYGYRCSRGHHWVIKHKPPCGAPGCPYGTITQ